MSNLHYRPSNGYFGDPIPFYWDNQYHLFYLLGQFDEQRRVSYTPYCHLMSKDLLSWEELPLAIPLGGPDDIDMSLGTGSIIERNGTFHLFYCGRRLFRDGQYETVCRATSEDLIHWDKDSRNPILIPDSTIYATSDFRDPYPFWNEKENRYWMVIASRLKEEDIPRRGVLALAVSSNLEQWELQAPLLEANMSNMALECPDIFREDGKWYLIYSADGKTCYRVADSLRGPWQTRAPDPVDLWNFYAAKTLSDGKRRFLFGWLSTKAGDSDSGARQWGGDLMIPRELVVQSDGRLVEICPPEILSACGPELPVDLDFRLGSWQRDTDTFRVQRLDGFAYAVARGSPPNLLAQVSLNFAPDTRSAGVLFRASPDLSTYYALRLEPDRHRVVLERWPRSGREILCVPEVYYLAERTLDIVPGKPITVQLFLDESIIEAFVDGQYALCCRGYDYKQGDLGFFVEHGEASFEVLGLHSIPL